VFSSQVHEPHHYLVTVMPLKSPQCYLNDLRLKLPLLSQCRATITIQVNRNVVYLPTQHSWRAHGLIFTTSGGSTPTFRHSTRATLTVFICTISRQHKKCVTTWFTRADDN